MTSTVIDRVLHEIKLYAGKPKELKFLLAVIRVTAYDVGKDLDLDTWNDLINIVADNLEPLMEGDDDPETPGVLKQLILATSVNNNRYACVTGVSGFIKLPYHVYEEPLTEPVCPLIKTVAYNLSQAAQI